MIVNAETCDKNAVKIESITCVDSSKNIKDCGDATVTEDNNIELNLEVYDVGDNATYEIVVKNETNEEYQLDKDDFNLNSDYIDYTFESTESNNVLGANTTSTVTLNVEYANAVPTDMFENGTYRDSKNLKVDILSTREENPETRTGAFILTAIVILLITGTLLFLLKKKRHKEFLTLLITSVFVIVPTVYALCNYELALEANVNVINQDTIEEYLVKTYPTAFANKYNGLVTDEVGKTVQATNVYFATSQLTNNVLFADYCWQIVRTTEQGGIKMIYNGVPVDGTCPNDRSYAERIIGKSVYNNKNNSPSYVGYMYNKAYPRYSSSYGLRIFGHNVTYENGKYTLVDTIQTYNADATHHFTCPTVDEGDTCEKVLYYYSYYSSYYIELENGETPADAINNMFYADDVNTIDSTIKTYIDDWYEQHMTDYTVYLDDNVYCNDRTIINSDSYGWDPNNELRENMIFRNNVAGAELDCQYITDQFSTSNEKAKLKYPIALITEPERNRGGGQLLTIREGWYWSMSPVYYRYDSLPFVSSVMDWDGHFQSGYFYSGDNVNSGYTSNINVRPVIALYKYAEIESGDGSVNNPFKIKTNLNK